MVKIFMIKSQSLTCRRAIYPPPVLFFTPYFVEKAAVFLTVSFLLPLSHYESGFLADFDLQISSEVEI